MKKKILTLLMSGCYGILAAQTTGTVVDENKQPLPAATVYAIDSSKQGEKAPGYHGETLKF